MTNSAIAEFLAEYKELAAPDGRSVEVYCWRVEQLERAGYSGAVAHMLAENDGVDLHLACDLIGRGCSEQTAYTILT